MQNYYQSCSGCCQGTGYLALTFSISMFSLLIKGRFLVEAFNALVIVPIF